MTGPRSPFDDDYPDSRMSDWPAHDLEEDDVPSFATQPDVTGEMAAPAASVPAADDEPWNTRRDGERRQPTTAEQAVPWLVGLVLALAGIVIVLLALIFSDNSGAGLSGATQPGGAIASSTPSPSPTASQTARATPSASPSPSATPPPTYGRLEMLYLSRPSAFAPSELLRDDFANAVAARVIAKSSLDISHYSISPDGTRVVAIVNGKLIAVVSGKPNRSLADSVDAATFGLDGSTVYAVKVTRGGANDDATISAINFEKGTTSTVATINFRHPATTQPTGLAAARLFDEGGTYRLYATTDGNLVFWVNGGGQWRLDPVNGDAVPATRQPLLWSLDGLKRITASENGLVTTLAVVDQSGAATSRVSVTGLVSHIRWSPKADRIVFTLGINLSGGGVRQDLYTWDLVTGHAPDALTANGASFGAEWLGVAQFWEP